MTDAEWCVVGENSFECRRCGTSEAVPLPCSVDQFLDMSRGFIRRHKDCKEVMPNRPTA